MFEVSPVTRDLGMLCTKSSVDRPSERNFSKARGVLNVFIVPQNEITQMQAGLALKSVSAP
jgi:hypothetical protein